MPSKMVLTFSDGSMLDIAACTTSFQAARGDEALGAVMQRRCDEGIAESCVVLGMWLQDKGRARESAAASRRACTLGLASSCPDGG